MNINETIRFFSGTENRYKSSSQIDFDDDIKISKESYLALKLSYDFLSIEKLELEMDAMIDLKIMEASVLNHLESFKNSNSYEAQEIYYDLKSQIERSQESVGDFFGKIWEGIKKIFQKIIDILSSIGNWFKNLFSKGEDEEKTRKMAKSGGKAIEKAKKNVKENVALKGSAGAGGATTANTNTKDDKTKNNDKKKEEKTKNNSVKKEEKTEKAAEKNESLAKNIKAFSQKQIVPSSVIKKDFYINLITKKIEEMAKETREDVFGDLTDILKKQNTKEKLKQADAYLNNDNKIFKYAMGQIFIEKMRESFNIPHVSKISDAKAIQTATDLANLVVYGVVKPSSYKYTPLQIVDTASFDDIKRILLAKDRLNISSSKANSILQELKKDVDGAKKTMKHADYEKIVESEDTFKKIVTSMLKASKDHTAAYIKFLVAYFKNIAIVRKNYYDAMVSTYKLADLNITEDQVFE